MLLPSPARACRSESGIPTFRGEGGLWTRIGEPSMTGYQEFLADPTGYMRKQRELESGPERSHFRAAIESAVPNAGHYALAELETIGVLRMIITQNVDDLHNAAGSRHVTEIHGNRTKMRCVAMRGALDSAAIRRNARRPSGLPGVRRGSQV